MKGIFLLDSFMEQKIKPADGVSENRATDNIGEQNAQLKKTRDYDQEIKQALQKIERLCAKKTQGSSPGDACDQTTVKNEIIRVFQENYPFLKTPEEQDVSAPRENLALKTANNILDAKQKEKDNANVLLEEIKVAAASLVEDFRELARQPGSNFEVSESTGCYENAYTIDLVRKGNSGITNRLVKELIDNNFYSNPDVHSLQQGPT
ncbi:MAG: hypothetical protein PHE27_02725 [Alphaproteobacteria bacterium]|nr:hypothetical protein [Alphaproteobacteria bacterium]